MGRFRVAWWDGQSNDIWPMVQAARTGCFKLSDVGAEVPFHCLLNQPGDALCYVSPGRCAASSLTSAKRITRLIRRGCRSAGGEIHEKPGQAANQSEWVDKKGLTQKRSGVVIGLCDRASG